MLMTLFLVGNAYGSDLEALMTESTYGENDGEIDLMVLGGAGPYDYSWIGPDGFTSTEEDLSGLAPGTYTVTVTDAFCGVASLVIVVEEGEKDVSFIKENEGLNISVYPNPTNGIVYIKAIDQLNVKVYSMLGEEVLSAEKVDKIDFSLFPSGCYLARFSSNDQVWTHKITVQ